MEFMADGVLAALPFVIMAIVTLGVGLEAYDVQAGDASVSRPAFVPRAVLQEPVVIKPVVEAA